MGLFRKLNRLFLSGIYTVTGKVLLAMLIIILPVNIFAVVLSSLAITSTNQQAEQAVKSILDNHLADIEKRLTNRNSMLLSLNNSGADAVILNQQRGDTGYIKAKARFFNSLNSLIHLDNSTGGCFYYYRKLDDMLLLTVDTSIHSQVDMTACVWEMAKAKTQSGWYLQHIPGSKNSSTSYPVFFLVTMIGDVYHGTWIELDEIVRSLSSEILYDGTAISFSTSVPDIIPSDTVLVTARLDKANLSLNVTIPQRKLSGNLQTFQVLLIISAIMGFLLIPFLFIWLNRLVLKPLRFIHKGHLEMEKGNQDYRITAVAGSVEFRESFNSFNHMMDSIRNLTIENYEIELARQRFEMRNLELQIKPHFLLNIFNLVYTLAERNDYSGVKEVVLYLSQYFRYIVKGSNELEPYHKEQSLIEGYIKIANVQYPGSLAVEYDYSPGVMDVPVPPLLVHSLIENIVRHVIRPDEIIKVLVRGRMAGNFALFEIMDNGPGLDEGAQKKVIGRMQQNNWDGTHIGLANAYQRLKYLYGEQAEIDFASEPEVGTCVTIRIPCNKPADELRGDTNV